MNIKTGLLTSFLTKEILIPKFSEPKNSVKDSIKELLEKREEEKKIEEEIKKLDDMSREEYYEERGYTKISKTQKEYDNSLGRADDKVDVLFNDSHKNLIDYIDSLDLSDISDFQKNQIKLILKKFTSGVDLELVKVKSHWKNLSEEERVIPEYLILKIKDMKLSLQTFIKESILNKSKI